MVRCFDQPFVACKASYSKARKYSLTDIRHYWIIDALDEAVEATNPDTFQFLFQKIDSSIPLKIFVTSRPSAEIDQIFSSLQSELFIDQTSSNDSARDLRRFVASHSSSMPVDPADQTEFIDMIVEKAAGNFLWAVLVMKQLNQAYTDQDIQDILEDVPQEIEALYMRTVKKMEKAKNKSLIQTILTWVICSLRPLSLDEMKDAITLSLGYTVSRDLNRLLATSCGQFVDVDQQSRIRIVHETARAFLTSETLDSDFQIKYSDGHRDLALACLKSLPHPKRRSNSVPSTSQKTELAIENYAALHWSVHVANATSHSDELVQELTEFFGSAVFSWIENLARLRELGSLIHASRHLLNFLDRRREQALTSSGGLDAWVIDLPRIVTQFGLNILSYPPAIHELVPPFCPRNSAIHQRFANISGGLVLKGPQNKDWSDRVSCIVYKDSMATALACMDQRFAVGLSDGNVHTYNTSTCEYLSSVEHGESVKILQFGTLSKYLASAGLRQIKLWDTTSGQSLFSISTKTQPLAIAFDDAEQRLITAFRSRSISYWNISDGELESQVPWTDFPLGGRGLEIPRTPHAVKISIEQGLMAVVYRGLPIQLWSLERRKPHGACLRPATKHDRHLHHIHAVLLNPNAEFPFLAVSYWDDVIFLFDVRTQKVVAQTTASLLNMAASPDGKTLAGCDSDGGIHIIEFETLQLLHHISVRDDPITAMAFTSDSSRILEIRGIQTNVWEPSILFSQDRRSTAKGNRNLNHESQTVRQPDVLASEQMAAVTALHCCTESGLAFVGRSNGHLDICFLDDPHNSIRELYRHRSSSVSISRISWSSTSNIIVTVDSSSRFRAMRVYKGSTDLGTWNVDCLVEDQLGQGSSINQIVLNQDGLSLLVSSHGADLLWLLDQKEKIAMIDRAKTIWKWFQHPTDPKQLILFEDDTICTFSWETLERTSSRSTLIGLDDRTTVDVETMLLDAENNLLVFKPTHARIHQKSWRKEYSQNTRIYTVDLNPIITVKKDKGPCQLPKLCLASPLATIPDLGIIIGITLIFNSSSFVYISDSGWVCSIVLGDGPPESFQRHFFFPTLWLSSDRGLIATVLESQDIAIAHEDSLFVVQDGLHNVQDVSFSTSWNS